MARRSDARKQKCKNYVFFVVHELRNGNGSCFFTSEFLNRFFSYPFKRHWNVFFLLSRHTIWFPICTCLVFSRFFSFLLQAYIVWSLYNDCAIQQSKKKKESTADPVQRGNFVQNEGVNVCWSWCMYTYSLRKWHQNVNFNKFNALYTFKSYRAKKQQQRWNSFPLCMVFFLFLQRYFACLQCIKCHKRQSIIALLLLANWQSSPSLWPLVLGLDSSHLLPERTYESPSVWNHLFQYKSNHTW